MTSKPRLKAAVAEVGSNKEVNIDGAVKSPTLSMFLTSLCVPGSAITLPRTLPGGVQARHRRG